MTQKMKTKPKDKEEELSLKQINNRLDVLDHRLDALDTMMTAIAERIMSRPINIAVTCPNCGCSIDIAMVGSEKIQRK